MGHSHLAIAHTDTTEVSRETKVNGLDPFACVMPAEIFEGVFLSRQSQVGVTDQMLTAGRRAFRRHRRQLDDLHDYFPCDLDMFLKAIYRAMARAS